MNAARLLSAVLVVTVLGVGACSSDAPTGVVRPNAGASDASLAALADPGLAAWQARELARVSQAAVASETTYELLTLAWKAGGKGTTTPELLVCKPQKYAATVQIVGPEGGDLKVGPHTLRIPAGALTQPVVITAEAPVALISMVELSPHGLRFAAQPTLTLDYTHCNLPAGASQVAYVDDSGAVVEWPTSSDLRNPHAVRAWLDHFSCYAVAYRGPGGDRGDRQ